MLRKKSTLDLHSLTLWVPALGFASRLLSASKQQEQAVKLLEPKIRLRDGLAPCRHGRHSHRQLETQVQQVARHAQIKAGK